MGRRVSLQQQRESDSDEIDLFDRGAYWKCLYSAGDRVASGFDALVTINPDIMTLLGSEWKFDIRLCKRMKTSEFMFHVGNDVIMDMTKMSDAGHIFRFQSIYHAERVGNIPIIFDSGASISITPDKKDFIRFDANTDGTTLSGITSTAICKGKGTIKLTVLDDNGSKRDIITEALYVPAAKVKLLSVQRYIIKAKNKSNFTIDEKGCVFTFPSTQGGGKLTFDLDSNNMLPQTPTIKQWRRKLVKKANTMQTFTMVAAENLNLDQSQKQLLEWHYKLGHYNMNWIRFLIRQQIVPVRGQNVSIATCLCQACQLSKQTRRTEGAVNKKIRIEKDGALKKNLTAVGGRVSTDQFVSSLPGRLAHTYGKESAERQFSGGTIFIDEASEYIHIENQVSLGAPETVRSKLRFEREALRHGVVIRGYHGDNGVYKSSLFKKSCESMNQTLDFCGVGAHHHNGVAERGIRTISTCARTMLLHSMIHWPEQTTLDLWPFAVDYAVFLWNRMPREKSKVSPLELFYSTKSSYEEIKSARVWGCPVYVLEPTLQDGKKLPRWQPRSKLGQFLGRSKTHASTVGLIKNVQTGGVSAQFHVVYDDHYSTRTVNSIPESDDLPKEWIDLFQFAREKHFDDTDASEGSTTIHHPPEQQPNLPQGNIPNTGYTPPISADKDPQSQEPGEKVDDSPDPKVDDSPDPPPPPSLPAVMSGPSSIPARRPVTRSMTQQPLRRSQRIANRNIKQEDITYSMLAMNQEYISFLEDFNAISHHDLFLVQSDLNGYSNSLTQQYDALHLLVRDDFDEDIQHGTHPLTFSARANAEDNPTLEEAMQSPDREGFLEAMHLELEQLESMDAWIVVPRERAVATGRKILGSTWVFKRKRFPDGSVKKLKARLVARGDQQLTTLTHLVRWCSGQQYDCY